MPSLTNRAFEFKIDEAVHFYRVFQRQFFGNRLCKAANQHGFGVFFGEAAAHEVVNIFIRDAADLGFMPEIDIIILDDDIRIVSERDSLSSIRDSQLIEPFVPVAFGPM